MTQIHFMFALQCHLKNWAAKKIAKWHLGVEVALPREAAVVEGEIAPFEEAHDAFTVDDSDSEVSGQSDSSEDANISEFIHCRSRLVDEYESDGPRRHKRRRHSGEAGRNKKH
jgi:hypothetical protein